MLKNLTADRFTEQRTCSQLVNASYSVFRATHKPKAFKVVESGLDRTVAEHFAYEQQRHAGAVGRCGVFYGLLVERAECNGSQVGDLH